MKAFNCWLLLTLVLSSRCQNETDSSEEEEPSIVGLFSGLLSTLTESASVDSCPGQCLHTLRALMCEAIDEEAVCPGSLRCCVEPKPPPPQEFRPGQHFRPNPQQEFRPGQGYHPFPGSRPPFNPQPPGAGHTQNFHNPQIHSHSPAATFPSPVTEPSTVPTTNVANIPDSTTPTPIPASSSPTTFIPSSTTDQPTTPAPLTITSIPFKSTTSLHKTCPGVCVTPRMTQFCDAVEPSLCPDALQCCLSDESADDEEEDIALASPSKAPERRPPSSHMTHERRPPNTQISPERRPPSSHMSPERRPPHPNSGFQQKPPNMMQKPPCPGTCLTSLFTFFCEQLDEAYYCPGEAKCCAKPCPGVCVRETMACSRALPFDCADGYQCCGENPQNFGPPPPPPAQRPVKSTEAPRTTTTSTTERPVEEELEPCPGTCINSILSFTCFRNAELSDLFSCAKQGTVCCAPKTAIREHLEATNATEPLENRVPAIIPPQKPPQFQPAQHQPPLHFAPQQSFPQPAFPTQQQHHPQSQQQPVFSQPHPLPSLVQSQGIIPKIPHPPPPSVAVATQENIIPQAHRGYVCGVKGSKASHRVKRIVGGEDSTPGEWCWQVALINSLNQYLCGGALIGTQWVLTAAHCVSNIVRSGDAIYVRLGDHDLTSKYGSPGAQTLRVATTYIHHNHNSQTLDNDIALLKLQGQAALKDGAVCLVCLPARQGGETPGVRCTVTGYGYMGEAGPIPLRIRSASLPIVSSSECIRQVNAVTEKTFVLPASSFCAGGEHNNDACQGDGGGPLVCQHDGFYELTGLVSWGFGCGREHVPGVYVKVSSFIGWINQIISVNN